MALPAICLAGAEASYLDMVGARAKHDISTSLQERLAQLPQAVVWLPFPVWAPVYHHHHQVGA